MLILFLKSVFIGLLLSVPTGPVGVLCIRNTLNKSRLFGFITGLWGALWDLFYSFLVVVWMTEIVSFSQDYSLFIKIIAFVILMSLGVYIFFKKIPPHDTTVSFKSTLESFFSSFMLVLTSPGVLLSFIIAFSSFWIFTGWLMLSFGEKFLIILGVVIGSTLWWYILSWLTHLFRKKLPENILKLVNKFSGVVFIFFAILILFYDSILTFFW